MPGSRLCIETAKESRHMMVAPLQTAVPQSTAIIASRDHVGGTVNAGHVEIDRLCQKLPFILLLLFFDFSADTILLLIFLHNRFDITTAPLLPIRPFFHRQGLVLFLFFPIFLAFAGATTYSYCAYSLLAIFSEFTVVLR